MRPVDFRQVADVYECTNAPVTRHRLNHHAFRSYSLSLARLIRALGELAADEIWRSILSPLRRYGYSVCSAPVPFNEPVIRPDLDQLNRRKDKLTFVYPAEAIQLGVVLDHLTVLVDCADSPYAQWLSDSVRQHGTDGALLLRNTKLFGAVERHLFKFPYTKQLTLLSSSQLTRDNVFGTIYVVGAAKWFPPYVFEAPRARQIHIACYSWITDSPQKPRSFVAAAVPSTELDPDEETADETFDAGDLLPVVDWNSIRQHASSPETSNQLDSVEAMLALLESDAAVFLEASPGSTVLALDLDADDPKERLDRIDVKDVRIGTYLLLRTTGGGDYVVAEADKHFLKDQAEHLRAAQRHWKTLLLEEVKRTSPLHVSLRLLDLGSSRADEVNVRNYISARSIRTREPEDFAAIMRLVGLGDRADEYWDMMGQIDRAHRLAGFRIRRQLIRQLEHLDLNQLERTGKLDITLPDLEGGALTAFRVVDVSPEVHTISGYRVGHPFEV